MEYEFKTTPYSPVLIASFDNEWLTIECKKKGWKKSIELREIQKITILKYKVYGFKVIIKEKNGYVLKFHSFYETGGYNQHLEEFAIFLRFLIEKINSCNPTVQGIYGSTLQFWLYILALILIVLMYIFDFAGLIFLIMKNHWNISSPSIIMGIIMAPLLGFTGYSLSMIVLRDRGSKTFSLKEELPFDLERYREAF